MNTGEAELHITCDTTKTALQPSRQESKQLGPKKNGTHFQRNRNHKQKNQTDLSGMMLNLRKTSPDTKFEKQF